MGPQVQPQIYLSLNSISNLPTYLQWAHKYSLKFTFPLQYLQSPYIPSRGPQIQPQIYLSLNSISNLPTYLQGAHKYSLKFTFPLIVSPISLHTFNGPTNTASNLPFP